MLRSALVIVVLLFSSFADSKIYALDRPVVGECSEVAFTPAVSNTSALTISSCSVWKVVGCDAAAAAASIACGGPLDPVDAACILAAVSAIAGCGPCLCSSVGCPKWCPCDGNNIVPEDPKKFRMGTCAQIGYNIPAGKKDFNVAFPDAGQVDFSLFKRSDAVKIYALDRPVVGECSEVAFTPAVSSTSALTISSCSVWSIVGCDAAAAAASIACGGPLDPVDAACVLAAVSAITGCGPCLCSSVGCPKWCPCDGNNIVPEDPKKFRMGTCAQIGYNIPAGKKDFNVTFPDAGQVDFSLFKRSDAAMLSYVVV